MADCPIPTQEERIGGDGLLYVGEHRRFWWRIRDINGVLVNVDGWNTRFVVKLTERSADILIDKTGTIIGTYNASESLNTQYVQVEVTATDMALDITQPKEFRYSLKRTDAGFEDILRVGPFTVEISTQ